MLGALIEKSIATPDYYPLSLNALVNACNQLSNREPVVSYDEPTVLAALERLREKRLASLYHGSDSRVPRYKHGLTDQFVLTPAEVALLCVLMLRGPQTVGELRTRSERLYAFASLADAEESLASLIAYTPQPLVAKLPRQPGTKESRYAQLLSAPPANSSAENASPASLPPSAEAPSAPLPPAGTASDRDRLAQLEAEVASLRHDLADLRAQLAAFKQQFE